MNRGAVAWTPVESFAGVAVDVDWEPTKLVSVRMIQINLDEAASTGDAVSAKILDASGNTVFNFESFTPSEQDPETEFTVVPDSEDAPIVPSGGKVTVDFANSDAIDPIKVIIGYRNVYGGLERDVTTQ